MSASLSPLAVSVLVLMMKSGSNSEVNALQSTCSKNQTNKFMSRVCYNYFAYDIVAYLRVKTNNVIHADASRIGGISQ